MKNYVKEVNISRKYLTKVFTNLKCKVYGKYSNTVLIEFPSTKIAENISKVLFKKSNEFQLIDFLIKQSDKYKKIIKRG